MELSAVIRFLFLTFAILADKTGKIIWHGHPYYLTEAQIAAALK
jgi:hypothetical protein